MHIGKRIQRLMKLKKITTQTMADYCGVTPGAVSNWFSTGRISKANLAKVAVRLKADLSDLISGDDTPALSQVPQTEDGKLAAALPTAILPTHEVKISQSGYELSEEAIELARWFDHLTDETDRTVAQVIATNAITQRMALRDAARLAAIVGQPEAPTTPTLAPVATPKKSPVKLHVPKVLTHKR